VVSTLCSKCPPVAIEFSDQMCPAVLYLLDETEPAPITSLWRAVLHVVVTVPVCYLTVCIFITYWTLEAVNIKKSLVITGMTN